MIDLPKPLKMKPYIFLLSVIVLVLISLDNLNQTATSDFKAKEQEILLPVEQKPNDLLPERAGTDSLSVASNPTDLADDIFLSGKHFFGFIIL
jgi:hypothetical protein